MNFETDAKTPFISCLWAGHISNMNKVRSIFNTFALFKSTIWGPKRAAQEG